MERIAFTLSFLTNITIIRNYLYQSCFLTNSHTFFYGSIQKKKTCILFKTSLDNTQSDYFHEIHINSESKKEKSEKKQSVY